MLLKLYNYTFSVLGCEQRRSEGTEYLCSFIKMQEIFVLQFVLSLAETR